MSQIKNAAALTKAAALTQTKFSTASIPQKKPNTYYENVRVTRIKPVVGKGNLKAFIDIVIGDYISIHGCRVIQQEGQRPWVSMPQSEHVKDGQKKYYTVIKILDKRLKHDIHEAILAAYRGGV